MPEADGDAHGTPSFAATTALDRNVRWRPRRPRTSLVSASVWRKATGRAGYAACLLIIRLWVRWKRSRFIDDAGDGLIDAAVNSFDLPLPRSGKACLRYQIRSRTRAGFVSDCPATLTVTV